MSKAAHYFKEFAWVSVIPLEPVIFQSGWSWNQVVFTFTVMLGKSLDLQVPSKKNKWPMLLFGQSVCSWESKSLLEMQEESPVTPSGSDERVYF